MFRIVCLLIGYVFGMIQTSYIIGKMNGIDIREHGSKNAGFTNTNRVLGIKKGAIVFIIDIFKAMLAFAVATAVYNRWFPLEFAFFSPLTGNDPAFMYAGGTFFASYHVLPGLYAGIGAVLGHCFPFLLNFRGGKGVACTLGLIIMLDWRIALISFTIGAVAVAITKYISVASLLITLSVPILMLLFDNPVVLNGVPIPNMQVYLRTPMEGVWLTAALCAFIWFLHRENIKRLYYNTENKFSFKKSNPAA
ncbi:MAG: glycerol-3-phosphate 1-O-acyltransferase PlsY [Firmicutes bacterium]|nr:glycerol-3-phosphate 1-O-acyltransferase PlsY [Bacillota bacterium]